MSFSINRSKFENFSKTRCVCETPHMPPVVPWLQGKYNDTWIKCIYFAYWCPTWFDLCSPVTLTFDLAEFYIFMFRIIRAINIPNINIIVKLLKKYMKYYLVFSVIKFVFFDLELWHDLQNFCIKMLSMFRSCINV